LEGLTDVKLKEDAIRVLVTPPEVFSLPGGSFSAEIGVFPVLLAQIQPVSAVLVVVPRMIVATVPVIVAPLALLMMIVGVSRHRGNQGDPGENHTHNHKTMHIVDLRVDACIPVPFGLFVSFASLEGDST
jgi:hypothetical protein